MTATRSLLLASVCCALALAACGSSSPSIGAASRSFSPALKYADCMRSHGVSNYPDVDAQGVSALMETMKASPAFRSAEQACAGLRPPAIGLRQLAEGTKLQLVAVARCMRTHGVPNLADPTFMPDGVVYFGSTGLDAQSPAVRHAAAVCHFPLPRVPRAQ